MTESVFVCYVASLGTEAEVLLMGAWNVTWSDNEGGHQTTVIVTQTHSFIKL